jgi:D-glycero-alpha-D-manno-heptose 1-phosphate guanylyltransferase
MPGLSEAVILAGGLGTRLRPVVGDRPKGLALVAGRPFLIRQLEALAGQGVTRVVLAVGFGADAIQAALGDHHGGVALHYAREDHPLGTGGALRQALAHCTTPQVLALNGDTFLDFSAGTLAEALTPPAAAALALAEVPDAGRYGAVERNAEGWITRFQEKGAGGPGWINGGVYALDRAALAPWWPVESAAFSFERAVLAPLAAAGRLRGVPARGGFLDIGTPEDYRRAQDWAD